MPFLSISCSAPWIISISFLAYGNTFLGPEWVPILFSNPNPWCSFLPWCQVISSHVCTQQHSAKYLRANPYGSWGFLSTWLSPLRCSVQQLKTRRSLNSDLYPQFKEFFGLCLDFLSLNHILETLSRQQAGTIIALTSVMSISHSHHPLLPIVQCLVDHYFYIFYHYFWLSGRRVNSVPVNPSWLEAVLTT